MSDKSFFRFLKTKNFSKFIINNFIDKALNK